MKVKKSESIEARIEDFAQRLTLLRQIELQKSGQNAPLCPLCGFLDTPSSCTCAIPLQKNDPTEGRNTTPIVPQNTNTNPPPMYKQNQSTGVNVDFLSLMQGARKGVNLAEASLRSPERAMQAGADMLLASALKGVKKNPTQVPSQTPANPIGKAEDFIDTNNEADPEKRIKEGKHAGKLPPLTIPRIPTPGSGGEPEKGKNLKKDILEPNKTQIPTPKPIKPKTPPSMGGTEAPAGMPGAPKPPSAPGSTGAKFGKSEFLYKCLICKQTEHLGPCRQ